MLDEQSNKKKNPHHVAFVKDVNPPCAHQKRDLPSEAPRPPVMEMVLVNGARVRTLHHTGLQFHSIVAVELV